MKALQITDSIPRYLLTKALGRIHRPAFWGPFALLVYRDVPEPTLPGPQWVRVRTRLGGICGSDLHTILLEDSPVLSALTSFPFTLGHENVGIVAETGQEVQRFRPGDRVIALGLLPCAARSVSEPCEHCRRGERSLCQSFASGGLAPGLGIGYCRDTGGSWSACFVAHESQLYAVPDGVSDENAVMVDAFSCALHAAAQNLPRDGETALVVGAGAIGLCLIAALRLLGTQARIIALARYPFQAELARRHGADEVLCPGRGDPARAVAAATGGRLLRPMLGSDVLIGGGVDIVFECAGSARSLSDALRLARSRGRVVLVGLASIVRGVDWTPIWLKELTLKGCFWCSTDTVYGRLLDPYQQTLSWMAEGRLDLSSLVTHRFRLEDYRRALTITLDRRRNQVVKSVFVFDDGGSRRA
ncbi:MAG: zinc-binding dehydrogenase [Anaerolineae bacterium]|nr:zinc-binding dehydrogenase [Anaerolineae bacterium]